MGKQTMELRVRPGIGTWIRPGVPEHTPVCTYAVLLAVAQDAVLVEAVETVGAGPVGDAECSGAKELLQLGHDTEDARALIHIDVVEVACGQDPIAGHGVVVIDDA